MVNSVSSSLPHLVPLSQTEGSKDASSSSASIPAERTIQVAAVVLPKGVEYQVNVHEGLGSSFSLYTYPKTASVAYTSAMEKNHLPETQNPLSPSPSRTESVA